MNKGHVGFFRSIGTGCAVLACLACAMGCRGFNPAIEPYVSFLRGQNTGPVDYVMGLFKDHDVVILSERMHPEATQWDMIYRLTTDPRFINEVGTVFTEYGSVTFQPEVDLYLSSPELSSEQARQKLLRIYRNISPVWPLWDNTNFHDYLVKLRAKNMTLEPDRRVRVCFTDFPWDWETATHDDLSRAWAAGGPIDRRDRGMAEVVITERRRRAAAGEGAKCLVVMNYRHAFRPLRNQNGTPMDNAGSFIFEAFPGRTANVLINTVCMTEVRSDSDVSDELAHDGMWDAAFAVTGNRELGFDFKGSPFGADSFDLYRFDPAVAALGYQDVFDGFVFFTPVPEHRYKHGAPGLLDESFIREVFRRYSLAEGTAKAEDFAAAGRSLEGTIRLARERGIALENYSWVLDRRESPGYFKRYTDEINRWMETGGARN